MHLLSLRVTVDLPMPLEITLLLPKGISELDVSTVLAYSQLVFLLAEA